MKRGKLLTGLVITGLLLSLAAPVAAAPGGDSAAPPQVEMGIFIDYQHDGNPPPVWDDTEDNYKIRAGITWSVPSAETYYVNPSGSDVSDEAAIAAVNDALAEWQSGPYSRWEVPTTFVAYSYDPTIVDIPFGAGYNGKNTVSWQSMDGAGGIVAACYYWYYPNTKTMVEFDIVFDVDETWGIGTGDYYDIQNIATHEWGHTLILFDLYPPKDAALTMYGWAIKGDIEKQTLGYGDALGVAELYHD